LVFYFQCIIPLIIILSLYCTLPPIGILSLNNIVLTLVFYQLYSSSKRIGGVIICVLASGEVDRGFDSRSGQTK
jgi:hypothetical protein